MLRCILPEVVGCPRALLLVQEGVYLIDSGALASWKAIGELFEIRRKELRQLRGGEEDDDL